MNSFWWRMKCTHTVSRNRGGYRRQRNISIVQLVCLMKLPKHTLTISHFTNLKMWGTLPVRTYFTEAQQTCECLLCLCVLNKTLPPLPHIRWFWVIPDVILHNESASATPHLHPWDTNNTNKEREGEGCHWSLCTSSCPRPFPWK